MKTNVKTRQRNFLACLIVISMVFTMILGSGLTSSFAAEKANITVKNIEDEATVKAYKIVGQKSNGDWENVYTDAIANLKKPTAAEITALAKSTDLKNPISLIGDKANGYKANKRYCK